MHPFRGVNGWEYGNPKKEKVNLKFRI